MSVVWARQVPAAYRACRSAVPSPGPTGSSCGILLAAEQGVDHAAGGIVHRYQEGELGPVITQPAVIAPVQLYQHACPGHPLTADPVLWRASSPWTAQSGVDQDAPQGGPADVDALSFSQQL